MFAKLMIGMLLDGTCGSNFLCYIVKSRKGLHPGKFYSLDTVILTLTHKNRSGSLCSQAR